MNTKNHYELAASVRKGKVWLDTRSLSAVCRIHQKRLENARNELEEAIEQGRYATFRIEQALHHPQASKASLQQMILLLEEAISRLLILEAGSRINTNRYTCLISQFREKQERAKITLESLNKNNTPEVFV